MDTMEALAIPDLFTDTVENAILKPEQALALVHNFYDLEPGLGEAQQVAHQEIALRLGRGLDAETLQRQDVLGRLAEGERIQFIVVPAMRAGEALIDPDPETNLFKQLETQTGGQFSTTYFPLGVTRHKQEGIDIEFHRYHPNGTIELKDLVKLDPTATTSVIINDFGSATGTTGKDIAKTLKTKLNLNRDQVYINAVIASHLAQSTCRVAVPSENIARQVIGTINPQGWIVGIGDTPYKIDPLASPKDWGAVMFGQEPGLRKSYGVQLADEDFCGVYVDHTQRLLRRHEQTLALNADPRLLEYYQQEGKRELLEWYDQRYLGSARFSPELREQTLQKLLES